MCYIRESRPSIAAHHRTTSRRQAAAIRDQSRFHQRLADDMQINVSGRKISVGAALRVHIEQRLQGIVDKYFSRSIEAAVTVAREAHLFRIDCSVHVNQGITLQAHGEGEDVYGAFDAAADRIEKQLRRYKRRIKNHHGAGRRDAAASLTAQAYVLAPEEEGGDEAMPPGDQPIIIAETRTEIPHVSVGDAVMLMDLAEAPAFMFRNSRNNELNMVYRRPDGNIGWIDPAGAKSKA